MFYDRFLELCTKNNISRTKACTDCSVSRTAWHKWEDGAIPNGSTINKFASYFGVSVGYLLGEETEKAPAVSSKRTVSDDDIMFALWGDANDMNQDDLDDVKRYAAFVRERKRK